jgi:ribosomal protein L40E
MMPEILTESFCERCGTRYTFEATAPVKAKKLGRFKTLSKGLKNYVLSDETSMDEAMAAARSDEERELTSQQLEAFQSTFNFCMTCRQYTCANCWNAAEGACLTCAPLNGYVTPSTTFLDLAPHVPIEPLGGDTSPWPTSGESREPAFADAATPWPDRAPTNATPPVAAEAHEEPVADLASGATAWPIEAELAAAANATPEALAEPDPIAVNIAPADEPAIAEAELIAAPDAAEPMVAEAELVAAPDPAGPVIAAAELTSAPDAADWAMAEAEASEEAQPEAIDDILASANVLAVLEPEPESADVAAAVFDEIAIEPARPPVETHIFESDIAPSIAELPDTDLRAADAARRTSDLLARLRPSGGTPAQSDTVEATVEPETPMVEVILDAAPVEDSFPLDADFALGEVVAADDLIGDSPVAGPAPQESAAVAPLPPEAADTMPADLLEIIGPPIEAVPEPVLELVAEPAIDGAAEAEAELVELIAEPVEVAAEAEAMPALDHAADPVEFAAEAAPEPAVDLVAEPVEVAPAEMAAQAAPTEQVDVPVKSEPEPVPADLVEQPTWRIVAPDPSGTPANGNGHGPDPQPVEPTVVAKTPVEPARPVEPQWPMPPAPLPLPDAPYLVSRRTSDASEGLWAASARGVVAQKPGTPVLAVQTCGSCGLSLSATARFCRRCGSRQGA